MTKFSTFRRAALVTTMLGISGFAFAQSAVKLTLGHGAAAGNPRHEASVKFAEVLKAKSAGRIEVQVAPSGQLGDDAAMVTALRTGRAGPERQLTRCRVGGRARVRSLRHAVHVLHAGPGLQSAGRSVGPGTGAEVGRQGHGGVGILGQRHPPHDQ